MMRTMAVWVGAVLMAGGLWSASVISQGLADEPAAPSRSSEATGGAAGNKTGGSETVPPVVEEELALPAEAGDVQERAVGRDLLARSCGGPILSRAIMPEKAPTTGTMAPLAGQPATKVIMPGTVPTTGTNLPNPDKEQSFVYPPSTWGYVGITAVRVQDHPRLMADVNGDGKQDIVAFLDDGVWTALSTGYGFAVATRVVADFGYNQGWRVANHPRLMADVNGDGCQDIVAFGNDGVWLALSTGTGFAVQPSVLPAFGYNQGGWRVENHPRLMADVNGDGRQDIVAFSADGVMTALSTGTGFAMQPSVLANFGYNQGWRVDRHPRFVGDLNNDGYPDIVGYGNEAVFRALGGPQGFRGARMVLRELGAVHGFTNNQARFLADVDGDRMQDLVAFSNLMVLVARSSNSPPPPPPAAPSNARILLTASSALVVGWNDNSSDERMFLIHYGKSGGAMQTLPVRFNTTQYQLGALAAETTYCFVVEAENAWGISAGTPGLCVRTKPGTSGNSHPISITQVVDPSGHAARISAVDADRILADASTVLQTKDSATDMNCPVGFTRAGEIWNAVGPIIIDTEDELDQVLDLPGYVKVVDEVNYCDAFKPGLLGCAEIWDILGPNTIVVERTDAAEEGIMWAHEYGHTKGLDHRDPGTALMFDSGGRDVAAWECTVFQR